MKHSSLQTPEIRAQLVGFSECNAMHIDISYWIDIFISRVGQSIHILSMNQSTDTCLKKYSGKSKSIQVKSKEEMTEMYCSKK